MRRGAACAALLLPLAGCDRRETVHPRVRAVTDVVFATGHLEADGEFQLVALSDGTIDSMAVVDGERIGKGRLVALQDPSEARLQEATSRQELSIARRNASESSPVLAGIEARSAAARSLHARDSLERGRIERLWKAGAVSRSELDDARAAFDRSLGDLRSLEEERISTGLSLRQALSASELQHGSARISGGHLELRSPGAFRVWRVWKKPGELARRGEPVATLGGDTLVVRLDVDEQSISKIRPGQGVAVELNTRKGAALRAVVSRRLPYFDPACQCYPVEARFLGSDTSMATGTLLQADILVDRKERALVLPSRCLGADRATVRARRGRKDTTIPVRIGISGTEWTEILSGVSEEDRVVCGDRR